MSIECPQANRKPDHALFSDVSISPLSGSVTGFSLILTDRPSELVTVKAAARQKLDS